MGLTLGVIIPILTIALVMFFWNVSKRCFVFRGKPYKKHSQFLLLALLASIGGVFAGSILTYGPNEGWGILIMFLFAYYVIPVLAILGITSAFLVRDERTAWKDAFMATIAGSASLVAVPLIGFTPPRGDGPTLFGMLGWSISIFFVIYFLPFAFTYLLRSRAQDRRKRQKQR